MEGVWATIFICHLIFGGHLLNIPIYFRLLQLFNPNITELDRRAMS